MDGSACVKKGSRSRRKGQAGGLCVERGAERRLRIEIVADVKARTLEGVIERHIDPAADVMTDSFRSYSGLERKGWNHFPVNHAAGEWKEAWTGAHTNTIETVWRQMKRHLSRFNGGWRKRAKDWIGECVARWKWRKAGDLMDAVRRGLRMG